MGEFADDVTGRLRDRLAAALPVREWTTERDVGGTSVDVAGEGDPLVLVELEWRRADPADNAAKLFRHLSAGEVDGRVAVVQCFTRYYDLASGGVASKRKNAEFVGEQLAETVAGVTYEALTLDVDPPKRGGERPAGWADAVDDVATRIAEQC